MADIPEPRDAATVMLVRDRGSSSRTEDSALEVFMLRRRQSAQWGRAYVFPGGMVDEADRHADLEAVCEGRSDDEASVRLGLASGGLAFWVAAVRECFEEAGVLLASDAEGKVVSFSDPEMERRFAAHRAAVDAGGLRLTEICERERLRLAVGDMHYFSHWITPIGPPRRYDTRFFVAAAPPEQVPLHDDNETTAHLWVQPSEALELHDAGELEMIFPTVRNLEAIGRFQCAADLLAASATASEVPTMRPRMATAEEGQRILLPGDPGYDEALPASGLGPSGPLSGNG